MSARFSDHSVAKWVILSRLQSVDLMLRKFIRRVAATDIEGFHSMSVLSSNLDTSLGKLHSFSESSSATISRSAVEVNPLQLDSEILDLLESLLSLFNSINIVSEFIAELTGQVVSVFFLNSDSPQNLHLRGYRLYLDQFFQGISSS